jgi:hypothetical protein
MYDFFAENLGVHLHTHDPFVGYPVGYEEMAYLKPFRWPKQV